MENKKDEIWKSGTLAQNYLSSVRGAIPFAQEQIASLQKIIKKTVPQAKRLLDLGCGDGILGASVLEVFPEAHGVFLDFNQAMIEAAKSKLPNNQTLLLEDYGKKEWRHSVERYAPFDIIVSGFSIHHQPDKRKKELYQEIYTLLANGGIFLNLEHVQSHASFGEALFDETFIDSLVEFHEGNKERKELEETFLKREDKAANILAGVEEQCRWLQEIGFRDVDCFFKYLELALFGGRRLR